MNQISRGSETMGSVAFFYLFLPICSQSTVAQNLIFITSMRRIGMLAGRFLARPSKAYLIS